MFSKAVVSASRLCLLPARQTAAVRGSQARFGTSSVNGVSYSQVPKSLQNKMSLFQVPNGLPVHLKGGPFDKIFFVITSAVCAVGLFDCCRVYYVLSYPQKRD